MKNRSDSIEGVLLGTALGDALGLPMERLHPETIRRRFGAVTRFHLLGSIGFVSDDTEQSALAATAILHGRAGDSPEDQIRLTIRSFRRSLVGWFLRLPFGIGLATLRACFRMMLCLRHTGVRSAGNGAAMRAAVIGAVFPEDVAFRRALGRAIAETTHTDPRAVEAALFVGELAALAAVAPEGSDRIALAKEALAVVSDRDLSARLDRAIALAAGGADAVRAAAELGTSGYVLHSVPLALWCFLVHGGDPLQTIRAAIACGGDTDSNAAIAGALAGALCGAQGLPSNLISRIHDGAFGPTHLRALAHALASSERVPVPAFSAAGALLRNLALYPVILAHAARRLIPF